MRPCANPKRPPGRAPPPSGLGLAHPPSGGPTQPGPSRGGARLRGLATSTVFTSNKTFSQWNEVFADVTIASAILDRVLHHCTVINIKGESYRLKERKEFMRQKQHIVNTLFEQGST